MVITLYYVQDHYPHPSPRQIVRNLCPKRFFMRIPQVPPIMGDISKMWCLYTGGATLTMNQNMSNSPIYFWQNTAEEDKIMPPRQLGPNWTDTQSYFYTWDFSYLLLSKQQQQQQQVMRHNMTNQN